MNNTSATNEFIRNARLGFFEASDELPVQDVYVVQDVPKDNTTYEQCYICYGGYTHIDCSVTSCNHKYHTSCLLKWLEKHNKCPTCNCLLREPIVREPVVPQGCPDLAIIKQKYEIYVKHVKNVNFFCKVNNAIRESGDNQSKLFLLISKKQFDLYNSDKMKEKMTEAVNFVEYEIPKYRDRIIYDVYDEAGEVFNFSEITNYDIVMIKQFIKS